MSQSREINDRSANHFRSFSFIFFNFSGCHKQFPYKKPGRPRDRDRLK